MTKKKTPKKKEKELTIPQKIGRFMYYHDSVITPIYLITGVFGIFSILIAGLVLQEFQNPGLPDIPPSFDGYFTGFIFLAIIVYIISEALYILSKREDRYYGKPEFMEFCFLNMFILCMSTGISLLIFNTTKGLTYLVKESPEVFYYVAIVVLSIVAIGTLKYAVYKTFIKDYKQED